MRENLNGKTQIETTYDLLHEQSKSMILGKISAHSSLTLLV